MTLITFDEYKYLTAIHYSDGDVVLEGGVEIEDLPFDELNDVHFNLEAYQYIDGKLVRDEEKYAALQEQRLSEKNRNENKPSQLDRIEAQITYTAMMTDTLLEA